MKITSWKGQRYTKLVELTTFQPFAFYYFHLKNKAAPVPEKNNIFNDEVEIIILNILWLAGAALIIGDQRTRDGNT